MSPMLTMIGHCRQNNIIYKYAKLHDHSSNRKSDILCATHAIFLDVPGEAHRSSPTFFKKKIFFVLMDT